MSNIYITFFEKLANTNHDTINYMEYINILNELLNYNEETRENENILLMFVNFKCNKFPPIETLKNIISNSNTIDELFINISDYIKLVDYLD